MYTEPLFITPFYAGVISLNTMRQRTFFEARCARVCDHELPTPRKLIKNKKISKKGKATRRTLYPTVCLLTGTVLQIFFGTNGQRNR
jgi:hypothetical protein